MSFNTLSAILRSKWLIEPQWVEAHLPLIAGLIEGKVNMDAMRPAKGEMASPFMVLPDNKQVDFFKVTYGEYGRSVDRSATNPQTKPGTVAVLPIIGPIMKYDGGCGEPGSVSRGQWFQMADADDNVSGMVCYMDSPGGQVDGTATLAEIIKNVNKPVITIIDDGMMASAAMWIGSGSDEIYASQPTDSAGSIGVYTTLLDFKGAYEKLGYKVHTIYAPESSEKNIEYRKAIAGDYKLMEEDLSFIAQHFHGTITNNRGDKLTSDKWKKGGMYYAAEAAEIGLIDGIKSFNEVVDRARELANGNTSGTSSNNSSKNLNNNMSKFSKMASLAKVAVAAHTQASIDAVNTEIAEAEIEGVVLVLESELEASATKVEELTNQVATLKTEKEELSGLKAENEKLIGEKAELQKKLDAAAVPPAGPRVTGDPNPGGESEPAFNMTSVDKEKAALNADW